MHAALPRVSGKERKRSLTRHSTSHTYPQVPAPARPQSLSSDPYQADESNLEIRAGDAATDRRRLSTTGGKGYHRMPPNNAGIFRQSQGNKIKSRGGSRKITRKEGGIGAAIEGTKIIKRSLFTETRRRNGTKVASTIRWFSRSREMSRPR